MEVILLEKVENLGNLGDKVKVRNGYGRNFLIPKGKALFATAANLEAFEARRAELEAQAAAAVAAAESRKAGLEGQRVVIKANVGDEGRLFGSIGTADIADAATAAGHELHRNEVLLPDGAFRSVGEYEVELRLHSDVLANIIVVVEGE